MNLVLRAGDREICRGVSDLPRPDVQQALNTKLHCGFAFEFKAAKNFMSYDMNVLVDEVEVAWEVISCPEATSNELNPDEIQAIWLLLFGRTADESDIAYQLSTGLNSNQLMRAIASDSIEYRKVRSKIFETLARSQGGSQ